MLWPDGIKHIMFLFLDTIQELTFSVKSQSITKASYFSTRMNNDLSYGSDEIDDDGPRYPKNNCERQVVGTHDCSF